MYLPNYKDGSIVNLMSSIGAAFGRKSQYKPLKILPKKNLKGAKNIVLIVFDGLGYEYLKRRGKDSFLQKHLLGKITSVFPSTTASAITTFATGTAPQQHAYTGWFMHLKEIGTVTTILRFVPRVGGEPLTREGVGVRDILDAKSFDSNLNAKAYLVTKSEIKDSDFNRTLMKRSKSFGYNSLDGFFAKIKKAINENKKRKYIYAYWPEFDGISHDYGIGSKQAENHFKQIDKKLGSFIKKIEGTSTTIIITADHGLIDTDRKRRILMKDHPKLRECLTLPLCGEGRAAYCYVHPSKATQFENYVRTKLKKFCTLHKSESLIKKNFFGLFKENPRLFDRVGDYVLIMKENYVFKDKILNQKKHVHIGNHGGVSKEEMLVPLIIVNC